MTSLAFFYNQFHKRCADAYLGDPRHPPGCTPCIGNVLSTFMTSEPALLYGMSGPSVVRQCGLNREHPARASQNSMVQFGPFLLMRQRQADAMAQFGTPFACAMTDSSRSVFSS